MKRILGKDSRSVARSKSIRGQISSPIPITDHMDEAVILPNITLNREPTVQKITVQSPGESTYILQDGPYGHPEETPGPYIDGQIASDAASTAGAWPAPVLRATQQRAVYASSTARNSEVDPAPDASGSNGRKEHRRQKSGFKGAMEKLFGKSNNKKKTTSTSTAPEPATNTASITGYGMSDREKQDQNGDVTRAASLPIADLDRALRSHSVGLEDVLAIESARNSMTAEHARPRKRATTMSSTYTRASRYIDEAKVGGLSPRPASPQDQASAETPAAAAVEDPEEIGKAITSDFKTLKRRSRSMSAIPYLQSPQGERRRRSEEVRYRRTTPQSHTEAMPPMSPNTSEKAALRAFSLDLPPSTPTASVAPQTPSEQFNFGDLGGRSKTNVPPPPPPPVEVQIQELREQPVIVEDQPKPQKDTQGLDVRVGIVEKRLGKLEDTVSEMQSLPPGDDDDDEDDEDTPTPRANNPPATPGVTSILKSSQPPVQEIPNAPTITVDQYNSLLRQLDTERTARQALETQVEHLSRQLQALTNSPTPSTYRRSIETYRLLSSTPVMQASVFDEDDDDEENEDLGSADYKKSLRESFVVPAAEIVPPELDDGSSSSNADSFTTTREGHRTFGMFDQQAPRVMALMSPTIDTMGQL